MAFTPDLTFNNSVPAAVTYSFISSAGGKTIRKDSTRPIEEPAVMTVSHETAGKGTSAVDRHLVRLDLTELDGDGVTAATGSVHVVLTVPRKIITAAIIQDLVVQMKNYLTSGNVTKILNGEPG